MNNTNSIECFPIWKLLPVTRMKIYDNLDKKVAFKYFRASSSAFIKKSNVRANVMDNFNNQCVKCLSSENLQIDHIVSVKSCFDSGALDECNIESNLQPLCMKCNTSKLP